MSDARFFARDDGSTGFTWRCPKCGWLHYGNLGPEPVSGWENPVWRLTGDVGAETLEPSLGCRGLQDGSCTGHYFLRDGKLVDA